jgi:hypothetical protein
MSDNDHYRSTRPMGRSFDGSVPRYASQPGPPDPSSNPYPFAHPRQPVRGHVIRTPAGHITPEQPTPVYPPEPYISSVQTAKNTSQMANDIRVIRWVLLAIFLSLLVLVVSELFIAVRISDIATLTNQPY